MIFLTCISGSADGLLGETIISSFWKGPILDTSANIPQSYSTRDQTPGALLRRTRNTNSKQCRHSSHPGDTHQRWTHFPGTWTSCPQQEVTERVPTGAGEPPPLHPRGCHLRTQRQEEMLDCFRSGEGTFLECKSYIVPPVNQFDGCDW